MPSFKVAHIKRQGVDLIVTPVTQTFHNKTHSQQIKIIEDLEAAAHAAGLKGTVVPVWRVGDRMAFIAPNPWHPFFKSITWNDVLSNVNKVVSW